MSRLLIVTLLISLFWCVSAVAQVMTTEENIDYYGGDYKSFIPKDPNPDLCRKACEGAKRCVAYTFVRPRKDSPRGKCYLKANLGKRTANKCCVSGKRATKTGAAPQPSAPARPTTAPRSQLALATENNIDYPGGDYTSFVPQKPHPDFCRKVCAIDKKCLAYTFVRPRKDSPRGRCYLKSKLGKRTANACCISGRRVTKSSTTPIAPGVMPTPNIPRPALSGTSEATAGLLAGALKPQQSLLFTRGRRAPFRTANLFLPGARSQRQVRYQVVNGAAVIEGDIVLGDPSTLTQRFRQPPPPVRVQIPSSGDVGRSSQELIVSNRPEHIWPGGVMPYTTSSRFNPGELSTIIGGINELNAAGTPIRLIQRTNQIDYIHFEKSNACNSLVGRQGRRQIINLDAGDPAVGGVKCWKAQVIHEILHAAGVWHEQSRSDRNNFVQVIRANIIDGQGHNFDQNIDDGMDIGSYDFDSIMHYGPNAFGETDSSGNTKPTIRRSDGLPMQRNRVLSAGDINGLQLVYANAGSAIPPTNQPRILTATVERLAALSEDACDQMEFYSRMEIGQGWDWRPGSGTNRRSFSVIDGDDIRPNWRLEGSIAPNQLRAKVYIKILDEDAVFCGGADDDVDVHPHNRKTDLELYVNLISGAISLVPTQDSRRRLGSLGDQLILSGSHGQENAAIQFRIEIR